MKSKLFYTQLFGVVALLVILLLAVPIYKEKIPKELGLKVQQILKKNGINWVAVRAEGRDITLSGIAPTIALHQQALEVTEQIREIRVLHDKISPTVITPYGMRIKYKEKELIFNGYMPSRESMDRLFNQVAKNYPTFKITKQVDIGAGEPNEWESLILVISMLMKKLDLGMVNIVDKQITFSGKCQTSEQENEILLYLREYTNMGFDIESRIVAMDEVVELCQKKFNQLLSMEEIKFEVGKSMVKSSSQSLLNGLADTFSLCPNSNIEIIGHTDSKGDDAKNKELSYRRANAIVAKLFQLGIPLEQMKAIGKGESEPLSDNETEEGRAKNRRIEFKLGGD